MCVCFCFVMGIYVHLYLHSVFSCLSLTVAQIVADWCMIKKSPSGMCIVDGYIMKMWIFFFLQVWYCIYKGQYD